MSSKLINYFLDCEKSLVDLISEIKILIIFLIAFVDAWILKQYVSSIHGGWEQRPDDTRLHKHVANHVSFLPFL